MVERNDDAAGAEDNVSESPEETQTKTRRKIFKWTSKMIEDLIATIESYKTFMEYKNLDFEADKHAQYIWVREAMAKLYKEIDETLSGPVNLPTLQQNTNQLTKEEQKDVRKKFKK